MMKKTAIMFLLNLIIYISGFSQGCFPDGLELTSQNEIDNFQINNPGCIAIDGGLFINGTDISDLSGLSVLTKIGGALIFGDFTNQLPLLTDLNGLNNITSIGSDVYIINIDGLTDLSGLSGLDSIGGGLTIWLNDGLVSLTGLENLKAVHNNIGINNNSITSLEGLSGLQHIEKGIQINNNDSLLNLSGIDNLSTVGGSIQ